MLRCPQNSGLCLVTLANLPKFSVNFGHTRLARAGICKKNGTKKTGWTMASHQDKGAKVENLREGAVQHLSEGAAQRLRGSHSGRVRCSASGVPTVSLW